MGRRFAIGEAGLGVHKRLAVVVDLVVIDIIDHHLVLALAEGFGNRVAQTRQVLVAGFQAVDDDLDRMVLISVELHSDGDFLDFAIDADGQVAFLTDCLE